MADQITQDGRPVDVHFEPYDPEQVNRYSEQIKEIRERCPVAWSDGHWSPTDTGFWLLTRYRDVREAALNPQLFSSAQGTIPVQWDFDVFQMLPADSDPPLHTHIRQQLTPFFLNSALLVHEERIRQIVRQLLDECMRQSPADFMSKYAIQLPARVLFEVFFGEDPKQTGWLINAVEEMFADASKADQIIPKISQWCASVLEARRRSGAKNDVLGVVAHAGNDPDFRLDERQRLSIAMMLIFAGMDTVASGVGAILHALATKPEIRSRLATADTNQINKAVDELLRFSSSVPSAARTLTADTEIGGCPMRKGERVHLNWAGANHDPEVYPDADKLDLERNVSQHLAFGIGVHKCLGMHLAKLELRLTIEEVCKLSVFELAPGTNISLRAGPAHPIVTLPIVCARQD